MSSYQSGLLYLLGAGPQGLLVHQVAMPRPMGLSYDGNGRLTVATGYQLVDFQNVLAPEERANKHYDACFMPRHMHLTGSVAAHDVGVAASGETLFVNTRFNCLAKLHPRHSFEAVWTPPFIDAIVDEDRCHLNGLAMRDGKPAYCTAISRSNTIDGWRDRRADGGVVIEVETGRIVCEGLSMPHSPRWHNGELWLLNSGTGELGVVEGIEEGKGVFKPRSFCPGFLRGLAFHAGCALVGLSRPRYERFEGLELDQRLKDADSEPWTGVQVIDLKTGNCVHWFRMDGDIAELYDVEVLPGLTAPMAVAPTAPDAATLITFSKPTGPQRSGDIPAADQPSEPNGEVSASAP